MFKKVGEKIWEGPRAAAVGVGTGRGFLGAARTNTVRDRISWESMSPDVS
jgi:hypothetical protein